MSFESSESAALPGLYVVRDFIDKETEAAWLADIDAREWISLSQRRVQVRPFGNNLFRLLAPHQDSKNKNAFSQHYGYAFDYSQNNVDVTKPLDEHPAFFVEALDLAERQFGSTLVRERCDQLTINEYKGGADQIAPHVDTHHAFGDPILSVSLGSHTVMEFRLPPPLDETAEKNSDVGKVCIIFRFFFRFLF